MSTYKRGKLRYNERKALVLISGKNNVFPWIDTKTMKINLKPTIKSIKN